MRRRFHSTTFVIRKKYMMLSLAVIPAVMLTSLIKISVPRSMSTVLFRSSLLCMDNTGVSLMPDYKSIFATGSIAFANAPEKPPKIVEHEPVKQEKPQKDKPAEANTVVESKPVTIHSTGLELRNQTSFAPDSASLAAEKLDFLPVEMNSPDPQVLIFHTHTTESYGNTDRTDNEEKNVVAIGNVMEQILTSRGINTLHCKTVHDYDYNSSYLKSYATVEDMLAKYPSIKVVLDVHRDGVTYEDGSGLRVVSDINGKTAAQFMLVLGTDEGGLHHPDWQTNLSFGLKVQKKMNEMYPGLARPLNLRQERFNQNLSHGMMIVECGGNGNDINEAKYGAELFTDALCSAISQ